MTYNDIVHYAIDNVPIELDSVADMINWLDDAIPQWRSMDKESRDKIVVEFSDIAIEVSDVEPPTEAEMEQPGFVARAIKVVKRFLGRLF